MTDLNKGIKHLIECHCALPQFKKKDNIFFHKFSVYSKFDKNDEVIPKFVQCNNCGVVHNVVDICKSELLTGNEEHRAGLTIEDMSLQLDDRISNVLSVNNCDYATWEHTLDVIEEERWGENIVLSRQIISDKQNIKMLTIYEGLKIKITSRIIEDEIIIGE